MGKFGLTRSYLFSSYLPYCPGVKVLDIGCGPGTCTYLFSPDDYVGVDIDRKYIGFAATKYPNHKFMVKDFTQQQFVKSLENSFDLVFAYGLFHHLDDITARLFMINAFKVLRPGGRVICFDGCIFDGQSRLARKVTLLDRGQYIREPQALADLAKQVGFEAKTSIEKSVYSIPYSLMILSLFKPSR